MRLLTLLLILFYCPTLIVGQSFYDPLVPLELNDDWEVQPAKTAGLNTDLLQQLSKAIDSTFNAVHSVILIKKGKIVFEKYAGGFSHHDKHRLKSVSKFITTILTGLAVDQGLIKSSKRSIFELTPEYRNNKDRLKSQITLEHLMTMTSGLEWRESDVLYGDSLNDETQMFKANDWGAYVLSKKMIHPPGSTFEYSGGNANLLGIALHNVLKENVDDFAGKHLFQPLGITDYSWWKHPQNNWISAAAGLSLKPRDLAKIGQLYLRQGIWQGRQIISSDWVQATAKSYIDVGEIGPFQLGYGYSVLVINKGPEGMPDLKGYVATGNGGQILWILPEQEVVVVMTGGTYNNPLSQIQPIQIMVKYLFPALPKGD